ncbi:alcohol dehydrogenase catalytic domain-containing protein [Yinghuangia seranimata]|uniref:alcohol dehydrogenase catalytic domain-containing protein n=1 Tax=Yinghuangia seranimata TaxID=408067 RepID=UPI00248B414E|nr:zinc-binding dehydrogenase [Yinghuangia seranimata]MDI2125079.1 zinc-binding dehydrogenase [Yinghuangia seranimata]
MRTMTLQAPGEPLVEREVADPVATGPHEAVIDVLGCGVCHSDLHVADGHIGRTPIVLGHEVVGTDARLGPVMVYAPWGCRRPECLQCAAGDEMICADSHEAGIWDDGGYASKMLVPRREYLIPLDGLDPLEVAPLACGGLTAFRAVRRATSRFEPGRPARVLVIGAGGLGQYAVQFLARTPGAHVTVVDTLPARLAVARELGADVTLSPDELDGPPYDAVVDFVGAEPTLRSAVAFVRRGGAVVLVGMFGGTVPFGLGRLPSEAWLTTSIWGSPADLRAVLDLTRREPLRHVVEYLPLEEANRAHGLLRSGGSRGRVVLTVS